MGVIATGSSQLLITRDQGQTWITKSYESGVTLKKLAGRDAHIFGVSNTGKLLSSTDTGNTFNVVNNLPSSLLIENLAFSNAYNGYIYGKVPNGSYEVYYTGNAGIAWEKLPDLTNYNAAINAINISYGQLFIGLSNGTLLTFSGAAWDVAPISAGVAINEVSITPADIGIAITDKGGIYTYDKIRIAPKNPPLPPCPHTRKEIYSDGMGSSSQFQELYINGFNSTTRAPLADPKYTGHAVIFIKRVKGMQYFTSYYEGIASYAIQKKYKPFEGWNQRYATKDFLICEEGYPWPYYSELAFNVPSGKRTKSLQPSPPYNDSLGLWNGLYEITNDDPRTRQCEDTLNVYVMLYGGPIDMLYVQGPDIKIMGGGSGDEWISLPVTSDQPAKYHFNEPGEKNRIGYTPQNFLSHNREAITKFWSQARIVVGFNGGANCLSQTIDFIHIEARHATSHGSDDAQSVTSPVIPDKPEIPYDQNCYIAPFRRQDADYVIDFKRDILPNGDTTFVVMKEAGAGTLSPPFNRYQMPLLKKGGKVILDVEALYGLELKTETRCFTLTERDVDKIQLVLHQLPSDYNIKVYYKK